MITIKKAASLTGLSVKAIRLYESRGLLPKPERTDAGYRMYSESDIARLQQIRYCREMKFPLTEIAALLDASTEEVQKAMIRQQAEVDRILEEYKRAQMLLQSLLPEDIDAAALSSAPDVCRPAIVAIDLQNDILEGGALACGRIHLILPQLKKLFARARQMADLYWDLNHGMEDPVGMGPKIIPETRSGRAFGIPMIYLNVALILMRCDPERKDIYAARATQCVEEIFKYFVKFDLGCTLENVAPDGTPRFDFTDGRIVNPGHDIEGVWFLLEYAKQFGKPELIEKAQTIFDNAIRAGWDEEYGGLLYFVDAKGLPPEAYEHDMKLWWPHNEILISSMMLYRDTGNEQDLDWFFKTLDYCQKHFSDPAYGEWYGYLRRDGLPTMPSTKGSTFKGPFHLPRCLIQLDQMMTELEARA